MKNLLVLAFALSSGVALAQGSEGAGVGGGAASAPEAIIATQPTALGPLAVAPAAGGLTGGAIAASVAATAAAATALAPKEGSKQTTGTTGTR